MELEQASTVFVWAPSALLRKLTFYHREGAPPEEGVGEERGGDRPWWGGEEVEEETDPSLVGRGEGEGWQSE